MAKGYWVVHVDVADPAAYAAYREFVNSFLPQHGGRILVRGGQQEISEGAVKPRTVVVEFPSVESARTAYHSAEYTEGKRLRTSISSADFAIVEGVEG